MRKPGRPLSSLPKRRLEDRSHQGRTSPCVRRRTGQAGQRPVNRLQLTARIVEREAVRYTPAGVPIASCTLQHRTEVVEAGVVRQIELTIPAVAAGEASGRLASGDLGGDMLFTGFLAKKSRNAKTLVFHITEMQDTGKD